MRFFFADDARRPRPTRDSMGPLVAIGGVVVPAAYLGGLEQEISEICEDFGFPPGQEFKWSPRRDQWMYGSLVEDRRREFFLEVLRLAGAHGAGVAAVIEDTRYAAATRDAPSPEADVTRMFLERVDTYLRTADVSDDGVVIADRPGGGRGEEDEFLLECLEMLQEGTRYVKPERIAIPPPSAPSQLVRLMQLADAVTSCTLAFVGGESQYAPPVFEAIRPLLLRDGHRIGGIGLKIYPDFVYANLYHWLLGDSHHAKLGMGIPFPLAGRPYARDPDRY